MHSKTWHFCLLIAFFAIAMVLMVAGLAFDWMGEGGKAASEYCEAFGTGWVRQPANSWSNLGFIVVGLVIALQGRGRGSFYRSSFYPVLFSFLAVFLGVGSFAYHASTTVFGGCLDAGSMFLLSSFMLAYALSRLLSLSVTQFALLCVFCVLVSLYIESRSMVFPGSIDAGSIIFGLFLFLAATVELCLILVRKVAIAGVWAVAFIITFIVSITIWSMSRTGGAWCDPGSLLQGHAAWHLLDAVCVYFMYRYYRSEGEALGVGG